MKAAFWNVAGGQSEPFSPLGQTHKIRLNHKETGAGDAFLVA
jgi:hypothetical protein